MRLPFLALLMLLADCSRPQAAPLRVCADPNNMPFSNQRGEGFENKLAQLIAADLGRPLEHVWWAQRRGNVRETLSAGRCDVIPGVASGLEMLVTTTPYYASTYVAVTRVGEPAITSFDDPTLRTRRIGVQMVGDDFSNTPPAHALSRRGITGNVRGYMIYGDYAQPDPHARIVQAVASGEVDVAFVWGPVAGHFADRAPGLTLSRVQAGEEDRLVFAISMGVRRQDDGLKEQLEAALARHRDDIANLLASYHVPLIPTAQAPRGDED